MINYSNSTTTFDFKDSLLEAVNIHNHNIHTSTGYRPIDIINNTDEEIYLQVMENIKNKLNYSNREHDDINIGTHLLIKPQVHKIDKRIIAKMKVKSRINKIPATVINNYGGGLLVVSIDISDYEFEQNEVLFINYNLCNIISDEQWNAIIKDSKKNNSQNKDKKKNLNI